VQVECCAKNPYLHPSRLSLRLNQATHRSPDQPPTCRPLDARPRPQRQPQVHVAVRCAGSEVHDGLYLECVDAQRFAVGGEPFAVGVGVGVGVGGVGVVVLELL